MRPVDRLWNSRRLALAAGDAVIFAGLLFGVLSLREGSAVNAAFVVPFLPMIGFGVIAAYVTGLYELRLIRSLVPLVGALLASALACWVFATTYFYLLAGYLTFAPKITLFLLVALVHAGMLFWRRIALMTTAFSVADLSIVILADEADSADLRRSFGRRSGEDFALAASVSRDVDLVVLDRGWTDRHAHEARSVLAAAVANRIPVVSLDEFRESLSGKVSPEHAHDLAWALEHVLPWSGSFYFTAKRVCDVVAALALLLFFAPLLLLVAIAVPLVDGASTFYGQRRIGYLGRTFVLWKFRTMREDADREGPFIQRVEGSDGRITCLGRFLRRHRIDELPQLWNVLKGDMSLVGPRPEWVREVDVLEKTLPTYRLRYLVPPGMTGWAQVYYRATSNPEDAAEKHNYDLYYLKHFSPALDLSILLKTIKRVMMSDSAMFNSPALKTLAPRATPDARLDIASIVRRN